VPDSGGPGFFRGGNGINIGYRFQEPGEVSIHDDRWLTYPWGVNGGLPGMRSRKTLVRIDGTIEQLPSKVDHVRVEPGDVLHYITWGGGGWGDPLTRDPTLVAREVERGLVTKTGARRYGVVVAENGALDQAATGRLREQMRAEREPPGIFSFGPSIDELRARAQEETGLTAPQVPVFRQRATAVV